MRGRRIAATLLVAAALAGCKVDIPAVTDGEIPEGALTPGGPEVPTDRFACAGTDVDLLGVTVELSSERCEQYHRLWDDLHDPATAPGAVARALAPASASRNELHQVAFNAGYAVAQDMDCADDIVEQLTRDLNVGLTRTQYADQFFWFASKALATAVTRDLMDRATYVRRQPVAAPIRIGLREFGNEVIDSALGAYQRDQGAATAFGLPACEGEDLIYADYSAAGAAPARVVAAPHVVGQQPGYPLNGPDGIAGSVSIPFASAGYDQQGALTAPVYDADLRLMTTPAELDYVEGRWPIADGMVVLGSSGRGSTTFSVVRGGEVQYTIPWQPEGTSAFGTRFGVVSDHRCSSVVYDLQDGSVVPVAIPAGQCVTALVHDRYAVLGAGGDAGDEFEVVDLLTGEVGPPPADGRPLRSEGAELVYDDGEASWRAPHPFGGQPGTTTVGLDRIAVQFGEEVAVLDAATGEELHRWTLAAITGEGGCNLAGHAAADRLLVTCGTSVATYRTLSIGTEATPAQVPA